MNNNQGTNADNDFQFRVRKIKNGMLVLHGGETTFCGSMASVKLAIKEALKNYERCIITTASNEELKGIASAMKEV